MSADRSLIDKAFVLDARDDQPARLVVDLVPTDEKTFLAKLKETPSHEKANESPLPPQSVVRPPNAKPVVVLDPGHGGVDPGAKSAAGVAEKEVVLSFAKVLKTKLDATNRYEIHLTREDDTFLPLRERVAFAQKRGASVFLSIHADYFPAQTDKTKPVIAKGCDPSTPSPRRPLTRRPVRSRPRRTSPTPSPAWRCPRIPTRCWPTS